MWEKVGTVVTSESLEVGMDLKVSQGNIHVMLMVYNSIAVWITWVICTCIYQNSVNVH